MKKQPNWKKMDDDSAKLKFYGFMAAPAYNTTQRITRSCMTYLTAQFKSREEFLAADLCSEELMERIIGHRHDHTTLESVLMIVDVFLDGKFLPSLKKELLAKFSDDEILRLTLKSSMNTIDYVKETIEVDVLISLLEGRAIFKDERSIEDFSREMVEIFESVYPIKRHLLKSA